MNKHHEAMALRQRAEDRSTRTLMCVGRVRGPGSVVVYFPGPEQEPVIVASGQVDDMPRVACSWCGETIREGVEPVSHGICPDCESEHFPTEGEQ